MNSRGLIRTLFAVACLVGLATDVRADWRFWGHQNGQDWYQWFDGASHDGWWYVGVQSYGKLQYFKHSRIKQTYPIYAQGDAVLQQLLDVVQERERFRLQIAAAADLHRQRLEFVKALGIQGDFGLGYGLSLQNQDLGNTVYGYTSYQSLADPRLDVNGAIQGLQRLAEAVENGSVTVSREHAKTIRETVKAFQAMKEAEIRALAVPEVLKAIKIALDVEKPANGNGNGHTNGNGNGNGNGHAEAPETSNQLKDFAAVVEKRCIQCHGSAPRAEDNPLDLQDLSVLLDKNKDGVYYKDSIIERLLTKDPKRHMPKGSSLSDDELLKSIRALSGAKR